MARIIEFPSGRRLDAHPFASAFGWGTEPRVPARSRLIGFYSGDLDFPRLVERLAAAGLVSERDPSTAWQSLRVASADRALAPLSLSDARAGQPWPPPLRLEGLRPESARAVARAAGWLAIDATLPPTSALEQFHFQLRVASLSDALEWYDASAERWLPGDRLALLAASPARPAASELLRLHQVEGGVRRRAWLHTHGLQRAGVPDLELFGVAPRLVGIASRVLQVVAARLVECGPPLPGETVPVSHDVGLLLLPTREVLKRLRRGTPGAGTRERRRDLAEDDTLRGTLVPPPGSGRNAAGRLLDRLLLRAEQSGSLLRPFGESARLTALAAHSLPVLLALWRRRESGWMFAIELGFSSLEGESQQVEHQWFEPLEMDGESVVAAPLAGGTQPSLFAARTARHDWDRLSDWYVHDGTRRLSPLDAVKLLRESEGEGAL